MKKTRLVWIDLEMTGLDPQTCVIVEIATVITEGDLRVVCEGPTFVIHQPDEVLDRMSPEVRAMHDHNGLYEQIRASKVGLAEAEAATLAFVRTHCEEGTAPLAGNSIHKDRQFIERYMPALDRYVHYRNVDVSTVKELARRWYPERVPPYAKGDRHRALADIRESIGELVHYRAHMFVP
ncbi:MAG: oligoribonuclease [Myxococcales bacterium]|nr:oligoribonuclease [Myxococcales bacterium]